MTFRDLQLWAGFWLPKSRTKTRFWKPLLQNLIHRRCLTNGLGIFVDRSNFRGQCPVTWPILNPNFWVDFILASWTPIQLRFHKLTVGVATGRWAAVKPNRLILRIMTPLNQWKLFISSYFILFHHGEQTPLVPLPTLFGSIASDGWMTDGRPRG